MTEDDQIIEGLALGRHVSLVSELSAEEEANELLKRSARSESVNIPEPVHFKENKKRINRSGSLYVEPKISDFVIQKTQKLQKPDSAIHLKERGFLRHMI